MHPFGELDERLVGGDGPYECEAPRQGRVGSEINAMVLRQDSFMQVIASGGTQDDLLQFADSTRISFPIVHDADSRFEIRARG